MSKLVQVDCVVEAVVVAIEAYDVEGLNRIWDFLHTKVFNGLDKVFATLFTIFHPRID